MCGGLCVICFYGISRTSQFFALTRPTKKILCLKDRESAIERSSMGIFAAKRRRVASRSEAEAPVLGIRGDAEGTKATSEARRLPPVPRILLFRDERSESRLGV